MRDLIGEGNLEIVVTTQCLLRIHLYGGGKGSITRIFKRRLNCYWAQQAEGLDTPPDQITLVMKQRMSGKRMILSTMTYHSRTYQSESNKLWLQLVLPSDKVALCVSVHALVYRIFHKYGLTLISSHVMLSTNEHLAPVPHLPIKNDTTSMNNAPSRHKSPERRQGCTDQTTRWVTHHLLWIWVCQWPVSAAGLGPTKDSCHPSIPYDCSPRCPS